MKHLHFTQSIEALQGGGLGKAAIDLHKSFLEIGADSRFVSTYEGKTGLQIPQSDIGLRTGPKKLFFSPAIKEQASTWGKEMDVFHGHGFYVYPNWALGAEARKNHKTLVYHPHGFLEPWILARSRIPKHIAHFLFESKNFAYAQLWRALTLKEADQIRGCGVKAPIVVAANGVHLSEYDREIPTGLIPDKGKKQILFMARIHPKKGLKLLLEIWPTVGKRFPDWEIIVAGPDEGGHQAELEKLAASQNITDSVRFIGTISGDGKLAWLKSCNLFILPSFSEGFSVAVLEAMTCRKPILITSGCNFPEVVEENAGWICEANHESLASALDTALAAGDNELLCMGLNGRKLVEKKYTWTKIASTIIDATHEIRN